MKIQVTTETVPPRYEPKTISITVNTACEERALYVLLNNKAIDDALAASFGVRVPTVIELIAHDRDMADFNQCLRIHLHNQRTP